jgi:PAS domain S-box-containing protein
MKKLVQHMSLKRKLYHTLSQIGSLFAGMQEKDYKDSINQSLKWIGELLKVDRIYIYKYNFSLNTCSNLFEYCSEGIEPQIENSQNLSLEDAKDWVDAHRSLQPTYIPNIDKHKQFLGLKELLLSQGVKSLYTIPLLMKDELYGFVGFDSVKKTTKYSHFEQYVLQEYANILISALERIELEEKLTKSQQELVVVFQAMKQSPNAVMITDQHSMIQYVNPRFEEVTGFKAEDVIGQYANIQKSGIHSKEFYENIYQTMNEGRVWQGEFYNKRKDGSLYWESASMSAVFNKLGEVTHYISIKVDITERKNIEELQAIKRMVLEQDVKDKIIEIEDSQQAAIIALAKLTEARDIDTGQHVERVQHLCKVLSEQMFKEGVYTHQIDEAFVSQIYFASALHDIGKISIPDKVLLKKDKLNKDEFEIMKSHVSMGEQILTDMIKHYPNSKLVKLGREIAKYHHEKWDGTGYLEGLKGDAIPISARIMALVDVYDALRSKRPYKKPMSHEVAYQIIIADTNKHFDPLIVDQFKIVHQTFDEVFTLLSENSK